MIILHIGMPKTGTSALQHSLALQAQEPGHPLVYPSMGRGEAVGHHAFARAIVSRGADAPEVGELLRLVDRSSSPVVISSEVMTNLKIPVMARLVERLSAASEVRVLLVVREMASFLESMYLQSTKTGRTTMSFPLYLRLRTMSLLGYKNVLRDRFRHIAGLRRVLDDRLQIELVTPGFNSLTALTDLADCPAETLTRFQSALPKNERRSLKTQVALLHLPQIGRKLGVSIDRQLLLARLREGVPFADDVSDYTLLSDRQYRSVGRKARMWAEQTGFSEYAAAFPENSAQRGGFQRLALRHLSADDMDLVAQLGTHRKQD